jgi:hypothetical protein
MVLSFHTKGQDETLAWLKSALDHHRQEVLLEKVFVHTDKSFYLAGELMWFKVYDVDGVFQKPLDLSKIAYLELLGTDQKPVMQAKVALEKGSGQGSFVLPLSLATGIYTLRAYTSWMKNFGTDYFFQKNISIVNSLKKPSYKVDGAGVSYDIHFFPEGGNLVNSVESKVGFRVVDRYGKGVEFTGEIIDQNNQSVAHFSPLVFGMGHFMFTPESGHSYKALVKIGNNNVIVSDFPKAFDTGYVVKADEDGKGHLQVSVSSNKDHPVQPVYLLVHSRQIISFAAVGIPSAGRKVFSVDKNELGEGISQITLFNAARQPVCERLYFKRPQTLTIEASLAQERLNPRKKVDIDLQVSQDGQPSGADLSVSVFRLDSLETGMQNSLLNYLWLSSDLTGEVESPEFYFQPGDKRADEAADNLMLTQGWRRFRWEEVLQNKMASFEFVPEYEGHVINGRITDRKSGQPAENVMTFLSAPGYSFELGTSVSGKAGQVSFDINNLLGKNEIVVQTETHGDSSYRVDILSPFSEKYSPSRSTAFNLSESMRPDLQLRSVSMQVQNAYLADSLQNFVLPAVRDSTSFYGVPDKKYFLDEYTRFTTMEEVMREFVSGVLVHKRQQKFFFRMLNDPYRQFFEDDPLILIDGVPVFDASKIIGMDPLKVKKIEVVNRKYFLGGLTASGILSYSTYNGDLEGYQLDPGALVLEYEGLQLQREFYSPVYETTAQQNSRVPDFRDLLYWSPQIRPDDFGKSHIRFYTSDRLGKYLVFIQGINANGRSGLQKKIIEVIK